MSVLSLGLILPFVVGAFPDRAIAIVMDAAETPTKHVYLINGSNREAVETHSTTVDGLLRERGITRQPGDSLSSDPASALSDGATVVYRPAVRIDLFVDGVRRALTTSAATVGAVLVNQRLQLGSHDTVRPALQSAVGSNATIEVVHATSWLERVRSAIVPPLQHRYDAEMTAGTQRVVEAGRTGVQETTLEVLRPDPARAAKRFVLAARILRFPRARVVAEGVGDYSALAGIARRGMTSTLRLADAALKMVATAYTAACSGCSGTTASGRPAGRGVVAVDPQFIPLGSHLFIPGYGHAYAGDTGGSIRGNRIDLGFDSHRDAMSFGRRPVVVYVLK